MSRWPCDRSTLCCVLKSIQCIARLQQVCRFCGNGDQAQRFHTSSITRVVSTDLLVHYQLSTTDEAIERVISITSWETTGPFMDCIVELAQNEGCLASLPPWVCTPCRHVDVVTECGCLASCLVNFSSMVCNFNVFNLESLPTISALRCSSFIFVNARLQDNVIYSGMSEGKPRYNRTSEPSYSIVRGWLRFSCSTRVPRVYDSYQRSQDSTR